MLGCQQYRDINLLMAGLREFNSYNITRINCKKEGATKLIVFAPMQINLQTSC